MSSGAYNWDNPSAEGAADAAIDAAILRVHTALPGRVVSFDPDGPTATVQVMIDQVLTGGSAAPLPPLVDVPVQFPRAGGFVITFPVKGGDEGQIIFNERCIDGWHQSGQPGPPMDYRLHDYSDASFIPGISSRPNAIPNFEMDGVSIRTLDGAAFIKIDEGGHITMDGTDLTVKCPVFFEKLFTYMAGMSGTGGGAGTTITGPIQQSGGTLSSNGVVLDTHVHSGVQPGGGNTGGPA